MQQGLERLAQSTTGTTHPIFDVLQTFDYEQLIFCQEQRLGLRAIIAVHDTTLGPAAGGVRMAPYESEQLAIDDVVRLARGMTYKAAAAGVNHGGAKCVVLGDPKRDKSEALFRALGRFVERLGGRYIAGEDVGTTARDMDAMSAETGHVFSLPPSEEVAHYTAFGVIQAMRACLQRVYGSDELQGRSIAVQGVGAVGSDVVKRLIQAGAAVVIADTDQDRVEHTMTAHSTVTALSPQEIHAQPVDVFCPCALGAVLNAETLPQVRCKVVCGAANNQLADAACGDRIAQQGIVYAPDYIANAGGLIAYADTRHVGGFQRQRALAAVARIYDTMEQVFALAQEQAIPIYRAADLRAEQRITSVRQAKTL
jgi:leucine dehydrogenase